MFFLNFCIKVPFFQSATGIIPLCRHKNSTLADVPDKHWTSFFTIWIPGERNRQRSDERDLDTGRWRSIDVNVRFPFVCLSAVCLFVLF